MDEQEARPRSARPREAARRAARASPRPTSGDPRAPGTAGVLVRARRRAGRASRTSACRTASRCEIAEPLLLLRLERQAEQAGEEGIGLVCRRRRACARAPPAARAGRAPRNRRRPDRASCGAARAPASRGSSRRRRRRDRRGSGRARRSASATSATRRDLPIPGSPVIETIAPFPSSSPSRASFSAAELLLASDERRPRARTTLVADANDAEGADGLAPPLQLELAELARARRSRRPGAPSPAPPRGRRTPAAEPPR